MVWKGRRNRFGYLKSQPTRCEFKNFFVGDNGWWCSLISLSPTSSFPEIVRHFGVRVALNVRDRGWIEIQSSNIQQSKVYQFNSNERSKKKTNLSQAIDFKMWSLYKCYQQWWNFCQSVGMVSKVICSLIGNVPYQLWFEWIVNHMHHCLQSVIHPEPNGGDDLLSVDRCLGSLPRILELGFPFPVDGDHETMMTSLVLLSFVLCFQDTVTMQ